MGNKGSRKAGKGEGLKAENPFLKFGWQWAKKNSPYSQGGHTVVKGFS